GLRLDGVEVARIDRPAADHAFDALALDSAKLLDVGNARQPARSDHRNVQCLGQLHGGVDVDAAKHAVAPDVGVDDGFDAPVLEFARQVDHLVAGQLAPAIGGNLAVLGVQSDDDVAAESRAGIPEEARILDRGGTDDDVAQASVDVLLDRVQVANAAAQLHRDVIAHRPENRFDRGIVLRLAGEGPVQVDQVQPSRAFGQPAAGHGRRVLPKGGGLVHVALLEAHAVAVFQVN